MTRRMIIKYFGNFKNFRCNIMKKEKVAIEKGFGKSLNVGSGETLIYSFPGLKIFAYQTDFGFLKLKCSGIFSHIGKPAISAINQKLKSERPAFVSDDKIYPSCWLPPIPSSVFSRLIRAEILISLGKFIPETVSIELVRQNNPNCKKDGPLPDPKFIKKIISSAQDMGAVVITFTEGDPLLNDDIYDYIDFVDKSKSVVMCYTWGLDFSPEKAVKLKKAGLQTLLVSLYSTDPKEHDRVRGIDGAYEKAVNAIKYGIDAGLFVTVATHVSDKNVDEIPKLYKQAADLGAHEFSIWESTPENGRAKVSESSRNKIRKFYKKINGKSSFSKTNKKPRVFSNTVFESDTFGFLAGRRWLHIGIEGDVRPDPYIDLSYGCAKCEPLEKIWKRIRRDPIFRHKRKNHPLQNKTYSKRALDSSKRF